VSFLNSLIVRLIKLYQRTLSKKVGGNCVYEPSCSYYAIEAIEKYGFWIGFIKTIKRLLRCRPPYGGYDPP
jgi:putative membrane protein insertion efficiency factor